MTHDTPQARPGRARRAPRVDIRWGGLQTSEPHGSARWAASDRGWAYADLPGTGQADGHPCVGFYLDYGGEGAGRARFFARAYVIKAGPQGAYMSELDERRFATAAAARRFVERAARGAARAGKGVA